MKLNAFFGSKLFNHISFFLFISKTTKTFALNYLKNNNNLWSSIIRTIIVIQQVTTFYRYYLCSFLFFYGLTGFFDQKLLKIWVYLNLKVAMISLISYGLVNTTVKPHLPRFLTENGNSVIFSICVCTFCTPRQYRICKLRFITFPLIKILF